MLFVNALDDFALLKIEFTDILNVLIKQTLLGCFIQAHTGLGVYISDIFKEEINSPIPKDY